MRVEEGVTSGLDLGLRGGQQRQYEGIQLVLRAVVGVQGDVDPVVLGDFPGEGHKAQGARGHVLDRSAGEVGGATGGNLDDAVGLGFGKAADGRVQGLGAGDVDGGEGVSPCLAASIMALYLSGVAIGMLHSW